VSAVVPTQNSCRLERSTGYALSDSVHNQGAETYPELATDIRLILAELAELLGHALKDGRELKQAVAGLRRLPRQAEPEPMAARCGAETNVLDWRDRPVCSKHGGRLKLAAKSHGTS